MLLLCHSFPLLLQIINYPVYFCTNSDMLSLFFYWYIYIYGSGKRKRMQYDEFLFGETGDGEISLTLVVAEFSDMPLSFQKIVC